MKPQKDSNCQTTAAWKVWISQDLTWNNVLAFFCHNKFSVLLFLNLFHVTKPLGMRHFCFWTSQHEFSKKLLKSTASGITCHFCKYWYYNNCWNSTLCCNWCKLILLVATEQHFFSFGWINVFSMSIGSICFWLILANSKDWEIAGWLHVCWCGPLYKNYKYHRHAQHNKSQV